VGDSAITIGRSPASSVRIAEDGVSRQHCVMTPSGGRLMLLDQGSTNGTFVNGARIQQARLSHGDLVQVGACRIRVKARTSAGVLLQATPTQPSPAVSRAASVSPRWAFHLIGRLSGRLARSVGAASVAELVLDACFEAFPVDRAYVIAVRVGSHGAAADVLASKSSDSEVDFDHELPPKIPKRIIAALRTDPHLISAAEATAAVASALRGISSGPGLCTPLRQGNTVMGAIYLSALTIPEWAHSEEMFALLTSIGDLAALALSRAQLQAELHVEQRLSDRQRRSQHSQDREPSKESDSELRDVIGDQQIELEARLEELRYLRASQANISKGLVNDVRSLIGVIGDNLDFTLKALPTHSEQETSLREAKLCVRRIVALTEDVALVTQLEEGSYVLSARNIDLGQIIDEAVGRNLERARERGLVLRYGTMDQPLDVVVDPALMGRALDHLIDNSLRYAGKGGEVTLLAVNKDSGVELIVRDTGIGLELESIHSPPGEDAPAPTSQYRGVGLFFCHLVAEAHGGRIRIENEDENNRYVISLPISLKMAGGQSTKEHEATVVPTSWNESVE
jgi:signal transduction histidine kinase